jgi:hypothetical protein
MWADIDWVDMRLNMYISASVAQANGSYRTSHGAHSTSPTDKVYPDVCQSQGKNGVPCYVS